MKQERIKKLRKHYQHCLVDDVLPFWLRHSLDSECGGYFNCLDRDGSIYNTDKSMLLQARAVWLFAKLYNTLEPRQEWLNAAKSGYDFIIKHGFDENGRMFFVVTRDGRPLKRFFFSTEAYTTMACAEYAKATGDEKALKRAKETYRLLMKLYRTPDGFPSNTFPRTRITKPLVVPALLLEVSYELRQVDSDALYIEVMGEILDHIMDNFWKRDERAVHETVGSSGERLDSPEGRCLVPGHGIYVSRIVLLEALYRNDTKLQQSALEMLNGALEWGWDRKYGGFFSFVDVEGKPPEQLDWDMKLWWAHTEALYATLLAHHITQQTTFLEWYEKIHEYTFSHFPDAEYGGWYGYLHRDGTLALSAKGSIGPMWKGVFHVASSMWQCLMLLEEMQTSAS